MATAVVRGMRLSYVVSGTGIPLVLLPGTSEPKEYWDAYQVPFFRKRNKVVTIDQRGLGESDRPTTPFSTRDLAADVIGVLDAAGIDDPVHIVGHSMGGRTAQWVALDHPDRVRSLVLVSSGSGQYSKGHEIERCWPTWQLVRMIEMGFLDYMRSRIVGRLGFTDDFLAEHRDVAERLYATFEASNPSAEQWLLHARARQQHETTDRLSEIRCPTLVCLGAEDTVMGGTSFHPDSSKALADGIPGAQLATITGAAHHIFWQLPTESNDLIDRFIGAN